MDIFNFFIVSSILLLAIYYSFSEERVIYLNFDFIGEHDGILYCLDRENKAYYFHIKNIDNFHVEHEEKETILAGSGAVKVEKIQFLTFKHNQIKFVIKGISEQQIKFLLENKQKYC